MSRTQLVSILSVIFFNMFKDALITEGLFVYKKDNNFVAISLMLAWLQKTIGQNSAIAVRPFNVFKTTIYYLSSNNTKRLENAFWIII